MSSEIVLDGNLGKNLTQVLSQLCVNLQKQYDISPKLINSFINKEEFLEYCRDISEKYSQEIKDYFQKIQPQTSVQDDHILNQGWESENCGFLIKEYPNGYKKYCNHHKYLHGDQIRDHDFQFKTEREITEEEVFRNKLSFYQETLNRFLVNIQDKMTKYISTHYSSVRIEVTQVLSLNEWLKDREDCFKTKFAMGLVNNRSQGYHFSNYIDVLIPSDKIEAYLSEIQNTGVDFTLI